MAEVAVTVLVALGLELKGAILNVQRNKFRLQLLFDRANWFIYEFEEVSKQRMLGPSDRIHMRTFEELLREILEFVKLSDSKGWAKRLWSFSAEKDTIQLFDNRITQFRDDIKFMIEMVNGKDIPSAFGANEWEDYHNLLQEVLSKDPDIQAEIKLTKLPKEKLIAALQRSLNESKSRSAAAKSQGEASNNNTLSGGSSLSSGTTSMASVASSPPVKVLKPEHFTPNLRDLSPERHSAYIIGRGSFGTVFKCNWNTRNCIVAVKMLKCNTMSKKAEAQLQHEVQIMSNLSHNANVIDIYGLYSEPGGNLVLVMSYANGGSLRSFLDLHEFENVTFDQKWNWVKDIAAGMAWLHSADPPVIHRDLKADNILLNNNRAQVTDFGCAVAKAETLTKMGLPDSTAGSLSWMPPESFVDGTQDLAGDMYAFGMVMWEIATSKVPWTGVTSIPALVKEGVRPKLDGIADKEYVELMQKCWHQNPSSRPLFRDLAVELSCAPPFREAPKKGSDSNENNSRLSAWWKDWKAWKAAASTKSTRDDIPSKKPNTGFGSLSSASVSMKRVNKERDSQSKTATSFEAKDVRKPPIAQSADDFQLEDKNPDPSVQTNNVEQDIESDGSGKNGGGGSSKRLSPSKSENPAQWREWAKTKLPCWCSASIQSGSTPKCSNRVLAAMIASIIILVVIIVAAVVSSQSSSSLVNDTLTPTKSPLSRSESPTTSPLSRTQSPTTSPLLGSQSPTASPLSSNQSTSQLEMWEAFFDKTGGTSWSRCSTKRASPCTCSGTSNAMVTCEDVGGTLYITSIILRNNNLMGVNVPGSELEKILSAYEGFTTLDLRSNTKLKNTRGGCLNVPSCNTRVSCSFDYAVCAAESSTPTAEGSSSSSPTPSPVSSSQAWRSFFDATTGSAWTKCKNTRTTPCDCQRNLPITAPIRVACTGSVIDRVSLIDNNLVAEDFPARAVGDLILAGATFVDLSTNPNLAGDEECFNVPECTNSGVTCILSKPLCDGTE